MQVAYNNICCFFKMRTYKTEHSLQRAVIDRTQFKTLTFTFSAVRSRVDSCGTIYLAKQHHHVHDQKQLVGKFLSCKLFHSVPSTPCIRHI